MKLSSSEKRICGDIATETSLSRRDVERAVSAYFSSIIDDVRRLPFNNPNRIYSKDAFDDMSYVTNIPYIGRIGTVYSRYIKWRSEEASKLDTIKSSDAIKIYNSPIVEEEASRALSGEKVNIDRFKKRIPSGIYRRVWIINKDGKKSARQMTINKKTDIWK